VDFVALKHATHVRLVHVAGAKAPDRGFLVPERLQERIGELGPIERLFGQGRDGFLNLNRVHRIP
jgi:hypothetical protein